MPWLEVSLTVDGELAEAVADVFARYAPNGVTIEQGVNFTNPEGNGAPSSLVNVRAYLPIDETIESRRASLEESLHYLGMIQPLPVPVYTPIADQDWMHLWKEHYHPISVGKHLIIIPAWLNSIEHTRISIKIDPGMAFGTGTHPTTQLCLEFMEEYFLKEHPRTEQVGVIDIGCGSGILSIAALKLGAAFVLGVDIDEAAIRASRENAKVNEIADDAFLLEVGSVAEIRSGKYQIHSADLILANIIAPVLIQLFKDQLASLILPSGSIILSGILEEQEKFVHQAAQSNGLILSGRKKEGDWLAMMYQGN